MPSTIKGLVSVVGCGLIYLAAFTSLLFFQSWSWGTSSSSLASSLASCTVFAIVIDADRLRRFNFRGHFSEARPLAGTNIFCKGSVDTTILGVDTMVQNKGKNVKKSPSQVDTSPEQVDTESSQVDTRDLSQGFFLPVWESVSTHLLGRWFVSLRAQ
ncbi:hypothetical protein Taro_025651 [Colocasia esculenta]|uniref:Uncharacterized protein n=1 Tax=Colocasia esculenta TaxID=4460 RepID=A0A843VEV4_COLES|nr:hypothetical protein [Colocasia esculenta]